MLKRNKSCKNWSLKGCRKFGNLNYFSCLEKINNGGIFYHSTIFDGIAQVRQLQENEQRLQEEVRSLQLKCERYDREINKHGVDGSGNRSRLDKIVVQKESDEDGPRSIDGGNGDHMRTRSKSKKLSSTDASCDKENSSLQISNAKDSSQRDVLSTVEDFRCVNDSI
jgi:hypothetical protein